MSCNWLFYNLLPPANEVWGKVIFSVACVKNSVWGGGIPACIAGGIPACLAAGLWGRVISQHALQVLGGSPGPHLGGLQAHTRGGLQAHTWGVSRPTPGGVSRPTPRGSPGPHLWVVSRPTPGGCIPACTEADPSPWTVTAVGGTHPTGMHSYYFLYVTIFFYNMTLCKHAYFTANPKLVRENGSQSQMVKQTDTAAS